MLATSLKEEIQAAYSCLLENKGYRPRHCQKLMIAEITRTLATLGAETEEGLPCSCVIEAGTGTGKTLAYALATLPIAKALNKKVVISTATVALQEQLVFQDLPDIRQHAGLDFTFALAKGRRRYLCRSKLDLALQDSSTTNRTLPLVDAGVDHQDIDPSDAELYRAMGKDLRSGSWNGDRDSWRSEVPSVAWSRVSTDHIQCTKQKCSHYDNCCFYRARENIHGVGCIVANHDLVLADLVKGGGALLPAPEDCIYIFDEGHHLPDKAASHFSHFMGIHSTRSWLQQLPTSLKSAASDLMTADISPITERYAEELLVQLDRASQLFRQLQPEADEDQEGFRYRFPLGVLPEPIKAVCRDMASVTGKLAAEIQQFETRVSGLFEETKGEGPGTAEYWLSAVSSMSARLDTCTGLCNSFAREDEATPHARWVSFREGKAEGLEILLSSCPISVAEELAQRLWRKSFGVLVTSATLSVAGDFSSFRKRSGISTDSRFISLPSPFDFPGRSILRIPRMQADPTQRDEHTREITRIIPELLAEDPGSLVLFTSWHQMRSVMDRVDPSFAKRVLCQGKLSKIEIIKRHKAAVDKNAKSAIFGVASFAEGIDLPGDYCTHVVIAKIPFAVPDDPVAATLSEWVEGNGSNPFREISLPEAAIRMVQMTGRLMRTETDEGQVTVLDQRLLTKFYGKKLLDALPAFRRVLQ